MTNLKEDRLQKLDVVMQRLDAKFTPVMMELYESDSLDPFEVAAYLTTLLSQQLDNALQIHVGIQPHQTKAIAEKQIADYAHAGQINRDTLIGEVIGLQNVFGTRLLRLLIAADDLQELDKKVITADDLDDGGRM